MCVFDGGTGHTIHEASTGNAVRVCTIRDVGLEVWVGCQGGSIGRWTYSFEELPDLREHKHDVMALAAVGPAVWSGCIGGIIAVWDRCGGLSPRPDRDVRPQKLLYTGGHPILCMLTLRSGERVVVGLDNGFLLFDARSRCQLRHILMHTPILDFAEVSVASPKARGGPHKYGAVSSTELWAACGDSGVFFYDCGTFEKTGWLLIDGDKVVALAAVSTTEVWGGTSDGSVWAWKAQSKKVIKHMKTHTDSVSAMAVLPNWSLNMLTLWVGSYDGGICIWVACAMSERDEMSFRRHNDQTRLSLFGDSGVLEGTASRLWSLATALPKHFFPASASDVLRSVGD